VYPAGFIEYFKRALLHYGESAIQEGQWLQWARENDGPPVALSTYGYWSSNFGYHGPQLFRVTRLSVENTYFSLLSEDDIDRLNPDIALKEIYEQAEQKMRLKSNILLRTRPKCKSSSIISEVVPSQYISFANGVVLKHGEIRQMIEKLNQFNGLIRRSTIGGLDRNNEENWSKTDALIHIYDKIDSEYHDERLVKILPNEHDGKSFEESSHIMSISRKPAKLYQEPLGEIFEEEAPGPEGFVYAMTNPAFEGWIKVGKAYDVDIRLRNYLTSDPHRLYEMRIRQQVENRHSAEKKAHEELKKRTNEWIGEWFKLSITEVDEVISQL